ncbi:MAG: hypothetical protein M3314_07975 [Actinomycetota bacterium]|nr:hypothetical protein [Actinomycetota bacterium]
MNLLIKNIKQVGGGSTGTRYADLGDDWFESRRDPEREARRLVRQLEKLGHTVTMTAPAA